MGIKRYGDFIHSGYNLNLLGERGEVVAWGVDVESVATHPSHVLRWTQPKLKSEQFIACGAGCSFWSSRALLRSATTELPRWQAKQFNC